MAKRPKNQDLLTWALEGAKERLNTLVQEVENIYRTFPSLRSGPAGRATRGGRRTEAAETRKRRRMSAAGRAKLRAAAKRRWAEAKKAGKKRLG